MSMKRPADDTTTSPSQPSRKRVATHFEHYKMGSIYSLEELDMKVLVFQNKKLSDRIEQRRKAEHELRKRIEQLENRQRTDDAVLVIVNRYWNQLDEDVRVLLQRLDAETADETETKNESSETTSFLTLLSTWDKQELEQSLGQRVEFSKRAIGKLLQAFDHLLQRNDKVQQAMADCIGRRQTRDLLAVADTTESGGVTADVTTVRNSVAGEMGHPGGVVTENGDAEQTFLGETAVEEMEREVTVVMGEQANLRREVRQLNNVVTELHQRHHELTLKISELQDKVTAAETESAELRHKLEDVEYEVDRAAEKADRLERMLEEKTQKLLYYTDTGSTVRIEGGKATTGLTRARLDEILSDLEENKELSSNRLMELERLTVDHQVALKDIQRLKMDLLHLPQSVVLETTEYKCLQSQFSVLYNETIQLRTQLLECRNQLQLNKNTHLKQIEHMEIEELEGQKRLRTEMIRVEDSHAHMCKEYEMLRIEFEQAMAANDQNVSINREMRNLIQSLQNNNHQVKMESSRYKRRLKEAQAEVAKVRQELTGCISVTPGVCQPASSATVGGVAANDIGDVDMRVSVDSKEDTTDMLTLPNAKRHDDDDDDGGGELRKDDDSDEDDRGKGAELEVVKVMDMKSRLKKSQDNVNELKLLLDVYRSFPKEQRSKVQLIVAEKEARQELDDARLQWRRAQDAERRDQRKMADDDTARKIRKMEDAVSEQQKSLTSQKQREEALLNDLEVTGQAFEDMQEQNLRLLQQLREKDDANFKLMSERIKSNQIQKLLMQEKDVLDEQGVQLLQQVDAQNMVVRCLEDKERILQTSVQMTEKESCVAQQALELHKRKAVESCQTAADLKLHLDKYQAQLKEAQVAMAEKTGALDQEAFKYRRMVEEVAKLQRKLERSKKIEQVGAADEVLLEEIKEYKEMLTCPSCKVNRKDAILVKCFHVFCLECLRTRYETRQRKCPKCNAGFGANDFHRLFLT